MANSEERNLPGSNGRVAIMWAANFLNIYSIMTRFNKQTAQDPKYKELAEMFEASIGTYLSITEINGQDTSELRRNYNQQKSKIEELLN